LPRIDTPKGWRFTFPPAALNEPIKDKKVLIIDDGSCTGETLLQMIDTISFLKVSKITVFSIIARLEDFQREFFSRIHQIRADYIKEEAGSHKIEIRMVPIEIFFGVNLHIPNYAARSSCPFCEEKRQLISIRRRAPSPPKSVMKYLTYRLRGLQEYDTAGAPLNDNNDIGEDHKGIYRGSPDYLPVGIDLKKAYLLRDKLGKLETYRLFSDYLNEFQQIAITTDTFEIFMAVLLHEPQLMNSINQFLPELKLELRNVISKIIYSNGLPDIHNRWKKAELLRFHYVINSHEFYKAETLKSIFIYAADDNGALDYLAYILWNDIVNNNTESASQKNLSYLIDEVRTALEETNGQKTYSWNILKEIYKTYDIIKNSSSFEAAFNSVVDFFNKEGILTSDHSQIEKDLIDLLIFLNREATEFDLVEFSKEYRALMNDIRGIIDVFIESFNNNDFLKRNFPRLYSTFFEADNSVCKLFARLDHNFALIQELTGREAHLKDCMLRLRESLVALKVDVISQKGSFAELIRKNERVDLIGTWKKVKDSMLTRINDKNIAIDDSKLLIENKDYVFIFKECLRGIFEELINNALKNENMTCSCNVYKEEGFVIFTIEQNKAFPDDYREGHGIPLIKESAEKFNGRFRMDNLDSAPRFELRLLNRT